MNLFRLFWKMMVYMTGWGMVGGAALGAGYGVIMALLMLPDFQRGVSATTMFYNIWLSIALGAPFGAVFGAIAGGVLGIVNGFTAGVLTRMIFSLSKNWGWYRLSIGAASTGVALTGGALIFSLLITPFTDSEFILFAGIPSLVAALVFGHASQRAAKRHLAEVTASKPAYIV